MFVAENCSSKFLGSIKLRPRSAIELAQGPLVRPPCSIHDLLCGDSRHRCCCGRIRPSRMSSKLWIQPCLLQGYLKAPCRRHWLVRRNQHCWTSHLKIKASRRIYPATSTSVKLQFSKQDYETFLLPLEDVDTQNHEAYPNLWNVKRNETKRNEMERNKDRARMCTNK